MSRGPRGAGIAGGLRLAVTTLTIAPVRAGAVNRDTARVAMTLAPAVGLALGVLAGGIAIGLRAASCPSLVTGLVCVGVLAALTRGLHLDGLADTTDGLGSFRPRERALQIMKSPEVGPFGVVVLVFAVTTPAACVAALLARPWWAVIAGIASAVVCGRTAVTAACRRGVPAAAPDGLGALVAGLIGPVPLIAAVAATLALSAAAVPGRPWQGPVAVMAGLGASALMVAHATRRLGGITGDVLGACVEIATIVTLVGLVLGGR